jgi:hypothetical protein
VDGDDGGFVFGAEAGVADGFVDEGWATADDDFEDGV